VHPSVHFGGEQIQYSINSPTGAKIAAVERPGLLYGSWSLGSTIEQLLLLRELRIYTDISIQTAALCALLPAVCSAMSDNENICEQRGGLLIRENGGAMKRTVVRPCCRITYSFRPSCFHLFVARHAA